MYFPEEIFKHILEINTTQLLFTRKLKLFKPIHKQMLKMHPGFDYQSEISYYILAKIDGMPDLVRI